VPQVAQQGAVGLVQRAAQGLAAGVIGFFDVQRHQALGVAGEHWLAGQRLQEVKHQPLLGGFVQARAHRKAQRQQP
jgi:hypothetical protein